MSETTSLLVVEFARGSSTSRYLFDMSSCRCADTYHWFAPSRYLCRLYPRCSRICAIASSLDVLKPWASTAMTSNETLLQSMDSITASSAPSTSCTHHEVFNRLVSHLCGQDLVCTILLFKFGLVCPILSYSSLCYTYNVTVTWTQCGKCLHQRDVANVLPNLQLSWHTREKKSMWRTRVSSKISDRGMHSISVSVQSWW